MKGDRARALIQNKDKVLLIRRERDGYIYYVLPGGHIEEGESGESAVLREVKEETSLDVEIIEKLHDLIDKDGTTHYIYVCKYIAGVPCLAEDSPEVITESGMNVYMPMWVEIKELKNISMWPAEVKPFLINYFQL